MAFDLAPWAIFFVAVWLVGRGALALLDAHGVRAGDRLILAAWIGIIVCAVALLGVSLLAALTPVVSACAAMVLCALGAMAAWHRPRTATRRWERPVLSAWAIGVGVTAVAIGAAALASDPVTLYDSLVYHVSLIRWLREVGTVPGMALIHNRLGHVSAWFTLAAAFDAGPMANRAGNVPLGAPRLFRWRVNDVDVLTVVPRPIADTLDYRSVIAPNSPLEKCSTAPLPGTPYLSRSNVRLRRPARGLAGGLIRDRQPGLAGGSATCVGELRLTDATGTRTQAAAPARERLCDDSLAR